MAVLINGDGYSPVTAQQDADFYAGIFGQGLTVLDVGGKMAATIESATCIRIADGEAIVQGRRIHNDVGTYDDFTIPVGEQGRTRHYIIGYRLFRDYDTCEKCEQFVEEVATEQTTIPQDIIRNGATEAKISMYRVKKVGVNIDSVTPLYNIREPLANSYPVGSIYMSVNNQNPGLIFGGTWQEINGKFLMGRSPEHVAGEAGGSEQITLTRGQLPSHTHTTPAHRHTGNTDYDGSHKHYIGKAYTYEYRGGSGTASKVPTNQTMQYTETDGTHKHYFQTHDGGGGTSGATGDGLPVTIMPPYLSVYMWVRVA